MLKCGECKIYACYKGEIEKAPKFCPMKTSKDVFALAKSLYEGDTEIKKLVINAARVESEGYNKWTRVQETVEFAKKCGFKRIGVAFCIGLRKEAEILVNLLKTSGFEVFSVVCKTGSLPKEEVGITASEKVRPEEYEVICNPIAQAMLLNNAQTDFNIIFGLCVGHDTLFIKFSKAPVTCLVVKDRVLAHNPIGAIYTAHSYYREKLFGDKQSF
ncbi:MAG: DUF1847 domain-containing protein [Archaeoglobaceae archaeon]